MKTILQDPSVMTIMQQLDQANQSYGKTYNGELDRQQPIQTLYGGAHLFTAETIAKVGLIAENAMRTYAPDAATLARALNLPRAQDFWQKLYSRVQAKLSSCPVEDFRIDFEDGFGIRSDDEEDQAAIRAAQETAEAMKRKALPKGFGIRVKAFDHQFSRRAVRTLELYIRALAQLTAKALPDNFIVTLPKVSIPEQVSAFAEVLGILEKTYHLGWNQLRFEIMIETPQAIIGQQGTVVVPGLINASQGRCASVHFGTYDYTAANEIAAAHQGMDHPASDFALQIMKVSLAGRGVWISDGATATLPIPPHRGETLGPKQLAENQEIVHRAWKKSYDNITSSLKRGIYQGWDLHPAQLPARYAACYGFFLDGLEEATARLQNFVAVAARATLVGDRFDDAATGQGLLNYFLRARGCGAIDDADIAATGLSLDEISSRSFLKILQKRRK